MFVTLITEGCIQPGFAMRRAFSSGVFVWFAVLVLLAVLVISLFSARTFADLPLPAAEEAAVNVLMNPHAGSNEKMSAARVLLDSPIKDDLPQGRRIIAALVRQSHYDIEPVRDLCEKALVKRFDIAKARRLIETYVPNPDDAYEFDIRTDFQAAIKDWEAAKGLATSLATPRTETQSQALTILAKLALTDPNRLGSLDAALKHRLVQDLDQLYVAVPEARKQTLTLLEQLGLTDQAAIPILQRALSDKDTDVHRFIKRLYDAPSDSFEYQAIALAIADGLTDPRFTAAAARWMPDTPDDSMKMLIAHSIAAAAQRGDLEHFQLLERYKIKPAVLAQAVNAALQRTQNDRYRIALLKALRRAGADDELDNSVDFSAILAGLLRNSDPSISRAAAELFTTSKSKELALQTLIVSIKDKNPVAPEVLKILKLDPESAGRQLSEVLNTGDIRTRQTALQSLEITGIKGDPIRAALAPLVRNSDLEIRHRAAQLLNTPEALARAKVPDLLNDIRSGALSARQLAARQLDEMNLEPREITSALVRATESGDYAARQGLLAALDTANATSQNALEILKNTAADKPSAARSFARAALRETDVAQVHKEAVP